MFLGTEPEIVAKSFGLCPQDLDPVMLATDWGVWLKTLSTSREVLGTGRNGVICIVFSLLVLSRQEGLSGAKAKYWNQAVKEALAFFSDILETGTGM